MWIRCTRSHTRISNRNQSFREYIRQADFTAGQYTNRYGVRFGIRGNVIFSVFKNVNRNRFINRINDPILTHSGVLIFVKFQYLMAWYNPRCETRTYPTLTFGLITQKAIELMPSHHYTTIYRRGHDVLFVHRGVEKRGH